MADIAAKREARRRRILENSEYRLQRITGHANQVEPSDERSKKIIENEVQPTTSSTAANGILASEVLIGHQSIDSLINELNADIVSDETNNEYAADKDIFTLMSPPNVPHRRGAGRATVSSNNGKTVGSGSMKLNHSNNIGFNTERQDDLHSSRPDNPDRDNTIPNVNPEPSTLSVVLSSRLIYVVLAIVVNIMVILKMEHLFGASIIVPFFIIMIGRLCVCESREESQGGNMLVAALILSNIRPDLVKVIHRLKGSFSLFGKMFQDFAVYMFTFVIMYTILYRYWNDLDDILSFANEPKGIINDNASM